MERAPAALRAELDNQIREIIAGTMDSEAIEAIIHASYAVFAHSQSEPAQTALRALSVSDGISGQDKKIIGLKLNYEALDPAIHEKCEAALGALAHAPASVTTATVFKALTAAIEESRNPGAAILAEAHDLITDYVAKVAALWLRDKLPASRATHPENPQYKSRLHRFVELALTAVTEPGSNRHTANMEKVARQIAANHAQLPSDERTKVGKGLRRIDREWLVSDDHVRKALGC